MLLRPLPKFYDPQKTFLLQWHLTSRCEGNCRFCYMLDSANYENELKNELAIDQCLKVVQNLSLFLKKNKFRGYVNLTGGDPLLKDGFWDILVALRNIGVEVGILGNPHLINPQTADKLRRYGITHYQLSVDGIKSTHDYFREDGSFDKTWKAARILREHGISVTVSQTISQKNKAEIEEIIRLCNQNKINFFRPTRLVPEGKGKNLQHEMLSSQEYKEVLFNTINQVSIQNADQGSFLKYNNCDSLAIPLISGEEGNCIALFQKVILASKRGCHANFLALLPDGTIYPCRRLPIMIGNILEDSLEKAYNSELSVKLRTPKSYTKCYSCDYVALCQGGCPAVTYAMTGDPFGKDPQCWVNINCHSDPRVTGVGSELNSEPENSRKKGSRFNLEPTMSLEPRWNLPRDLTRDGDDNKQSKLFQPLKIGSLETKNRIFRSATLEGVANPDGSPAEGHSRIYRELIEGECGLIITGIAYVSEDAKINANQNGIHEDYLIEKWKKITDEVHGFGGKVAMQLTHQSILDIPFEGELIGPSSHIYPGKTGGLVSSREMTEKEILTVIEQFKNAILRTEEAGFDGVQLQLAHSYLLGLFLSPQVNLRKDQWGGSIENRLRLTTEIVKKAKKELENTKFPIMVKINSSDAVPGGLTYQEASRAVEILTAGGVDAFELSGSGAVRTGLIAEKDECYFEKESLFIRENNPRVIIGVCGGVRSRDKMEELLKKGFDFVSMCRPFIREPDLVKRLKEDKNYKPQCVSCSICHIKIKHYPLHCYLKP